MTRSPDHEPARPAAGRRALFRATALLLPLALLIGVECAFRVVGVGHDPSFLVNGPRQGTVVTNERFGWRFFPPEVARTPALVEVTRDKPADVYRVLVVGGSAAMGTPDAMYGLARQLEAMFPDGIGGRRVEVINAAMTAINSHVVLPIVRDSMVLDPDLVVVYLGNNEVVGPYGAGTVFTGFTGNLRVVRAGIWFRATRVGQLVGRLTRGKGAAGGRWRGMAAFENRRVAADDPRLATVYSHFEANLTDIVRAATSAGGDVILSTVITNLADCPPFASIDPPAPSPAWRSAWAAARDAFERDDLAGAGAAAERAQTEYDAHAELAYIDGRAKLDAGVRGAAARLARARDLDALRFRADSSINAVIRRVAERAGRGTSAGGGRVVLVDALAQFPEAPGSEVLFEHVHLTFEGNFRLASLVADAIRSRNDLPPADDVSPADVAARIGFTFRDGAEMVSTITRTMSGPPFTGQLDHERRDAVRRRRVIALLDSARTPAASRLALAAYARARSLRPDDPYLAHKVASVHLDEGRAAEAEAIWRQLVDRYPWKTDWLERLATAELANDEPDAAVRTLRRLLELNPYLVDIHARIGAIERDRGRPDEAIAWLERAIARVPDDGAWRMELGRAQREAGRLEAADATFASIPREDAAYPDAAFERGAMALDAGEVATAERLFRTALTARPSFGPCRSRLALLLLGAGRFDEARHELETLVAQDPDDVRALNNLGSLASRRGDVAAARAYFERALAIDPDYEEARRNLERLSARR